MGHIPHERGRLWGGDAAMNPIETDDAWLKNYPKPTPAERGRDRRALNRHVHAIKTRNSFQLRRKVR